MKVGGPDMAPHTDCPSGATPPSRSPGQTLGGVPGNPGRPSMDGFVPVTRASALSPGQMTWVAVDGLRVLLANVDGAFYALRDACGHRQAPLSRGTLSGHVVECPLHFAHFDVRSGALVNGPVSADVPTYAVEVEGDTVYVNVRRSSRDAGRGDAP
jgi:nitrite reductase/ring-hydroxylating ferredoxin subunit